MFNLFNKTDSDIKQDVSNELMWDPSVSSNQVNVSAKDGIVTLSGTVPHFIEKQAAEQAAQRVGGVRAVADELEVKTVFDKSDSVGGDRVTLTGNVHSFSEKDDAREAAWMAPGVMTVENNLRITQ